MGSDEHVGKGQQSGQFVVLQYLAGMVLKKDAFLFLIDIQRYAADMAGFERRDALGSRRGFRTEPEFMEAPRDALRAGSLREVFAVVGLGVVNGDFNPGCGGFWSHRTVLFSVREAWR